jgi:hypothetical protein
MHRYQALATKDLTKAKICGTFTFTLTVGLDFNRFSRFDTGD